MFYLKALFTSALAIATCGAGLGIYSVGANSSERANENAEKRISKLVTENPYSKMLVNNIETKSKDVIDQAEELAKKDAEIDSLKKTIVSKDLLINDKNKCQNELTKKLETAGWHGKYVDSIKKSKECEQLGKYK